MAKIRLNADEYPEQLGMLQGGQKVKLVITARVAMVSDSLAQKEVLLQVDTLEVHPLSTPSTEDTFRDIASKMTRDGIPFVETTFRPAV